jgi:glyoxylase-like metal-dependent hydrolase (beta-lactamase superfamily II)
LHTQGHAKHHFVVDDPKTGTVYTGDSFGLAYPALQKDGKRFAIATTSPTDFDPAEARKSIDRIVALGEPAACLTHFDEVRDIAEVARQLHAWIDRSEEWRDQAAKSSASVTEMTTDIQRKLFAAIESDVQSRGIVFGPDEWKVLALDIELNAQGIAFVADRMRSK